jgi:hypothetical protein
LETGGGGTGDSVEGGEDFFDYVEPEGDEIDDLVSYKNHPRSKDNLLSVFMPTICICVCGRDTSGFAKMIIPTIA